MRPLLLLTAVLGAWLAQTVLLRASECPESLARRPPVEAAIEHAFGFRLHPVMGSAVFQRSIVFRTNSGSLVRTVRGGRVALLETQPQIGQFVWVRQRDGSELRYGPLSQIRVRTGRCVAAGASLGRTTSSPFTFALWWNGKWIDPAPLLGAGQ
ncbi:M23 family metallopeptidase [Pseudoxanthobacter soli]|uniref:M23 family metallopeptidase n=1 Tax=Pseudoxanthobacter soli TaxID=433840 RepID=UPI000935838F|nr:M23 family metallopeptidase [Pseudoxanthobacter soli]